VWVQHFDLQLTNGIPESRRRIETRTLVRWSNGAASGVYGLSYRWDQTQTNATLVDAGGSSDTFVIYDGSNSHTQTWIYPGQSDCMSCHVSRSAYAGGFHAPQLNRDFDYGGVVDNQLRALNNAGYFNPAITEINSLLTMARPEQTQFSTEHRVRSYLMANCASCHQPGITNVGGFDARIYRSLSDLGIVNGALTNTMGNASNRVVQPGSLDYSMILSRISRLDNFRMPPAGTTMLDTQAIALVSFWITNDLPSYRSFARWQLDYFTATNTSEALATADPDGDQANNMVEWLTGTDPTNSLAFWPGLSHTLTGDLLTLQFPLIANRGFEVQQNTDLTNTAGWRFLDVPENRPFFAATNQTRTLADPTTNAPVKFYRVRAYEP
jgi:hypothetical protein